MSQPPAHRDPWRAYLEASLLLETRLDEDLRATAGLSLFDYHLLLLLAEAPGRRLRMGELARRLVFSASRVTYQVKSLEKRNLVLRRPSRTDRRVSYAVLTAAGLDVLRAAAPHHSDTVHRLFLDDLDPAETRVIDRVFNRLWNRLTEED